MRENARFGARNEPIMKMSIREAKLMTLLIGLVSDRWQGDRLNMLPHHGFTREDVQNLSGRLLEFKMLNITYPNKRDGSRYPGSLVANRIQGLTAGSAR
ncbi:MAG: hypothetical protein PHV74_06240 [Dehalococcoidia bacterium]|nr:hypothetical protein [Dehalococcoidia bacterium]